MGRSRNWQAASHPVPHLPPCASPDYKVSLHIKHSIASIYNLWTVSHIQGRSAWGVGVEEGGNNYPPRTWIRWDLHPSSAINIAESSRDKHTCSAEANAACQPTDAQSPLHASSLRITQVSKRMQLSPSHSSPICTPKWRLHWISLTVWVVSPRGPRYIISPLVQLVEASALPATSLHLAAQPHQYVPTWWKRTAHHPPPSASPLSPACHKRCLCAGVASRDNRKPGSSYTC